MSQSLVTLHPSFKHLSVSIIQRTHQICFRSEKFKFSFPFKSGPNCSRSCKYILGFIDGDMPALNYHVGQPMQMNLDIGLSKDQLEILMDELFVKFGNGSGEFQFEEFRDFYVAYLDTEESLERLRNYAQYRFRNIELQRLLEEERVETEKRIAKRKETKEKNKKFVAAQREIFLKDSIVDVYGSRRRLNQHTNAMKLPKIQKIDSEMKVEMCEYDNVVTAQGAVEVKEENESKKRKKYIVKRDELKDRLQRQKERRALVLKQIFAANEELNRKEKSDAKKNALKQVLAYMTNVHNQIREGLHRIMLPASEAGINMSNSQLENIISHANLLKVVATPAIRIRGKETLSLDEEYIGIDELKPEEIDLAELNSSKLHPAGQRYFFIRRTREIRAAYDPKMKIGDASKRHPAFFTADFERRPVRYSGASMTLARLVMQQREEGVLYRASRGIQRVKRVPPEDMIPPKVDLSKGHSKVRFDEEKLIALEVKDKGLLGRGTILCIKLSRLRKVHGLEVNSPFVTVQCGGWKFTSEINCFAGTKFFS